MDYTELEIISDQEEVEGVVTVEDGYERIQEERIREDRT